MRLIDADAEIEKMSEEMTRAMAEIARCTRENLEKLNAAYDELKKWGVDTKKGVDVDGAEH